jgi:acyl carrier protein
MTTKKILIVDDEKNLTASLNSFFKSKGHDIFIANSGKAALEILKKQAMDLLVLDLNMPEVDGFEVAGTIKETHPETKILILTAYSEEYKNKLASLKPDAIMTKPFGVLELIDKVQTLLGEEIVAVPKPEGPIKFKPVKVLFIDPARSHIIKNYVLPYIKLSWMRNIEIDFTAPSSDYAVRNKIESFKPDIVLLSTVLSEQAKDISKAIEEGIYKPKEVILYNIPDENQTKDSPVGAYYSMQDSLTEPGYLNRLNELIKAVALKHGLVDETAFRKEKLYMPESIKQFTLDDIASFVKDAISNELGLKGVELNEKTSFINDLGVDSLETIQLVMALEDTFGLELPDEDAQKLQTVGDAIEYIKKKVNLEAFTRRKKSAHKILIVDDQEGMCNFLENYFYSKGYKATSASKADEALLLLDKEKPDIVLLDIRMPDIDGIELLKKMKAKNPKPKFLMVSVASEREKEAVEAGADGFVSKPFPITYLEQTVIKKIKEFMVS